MDASARWYTMLGFRPLGETSRPAPGVVVGLLERDGLRLELVHVPGSMDRHGVLPTPGNDASVRGLFKLGVELPALDPVLGTLRARGTRVRGEPYADTAFGARYVLVEDPDGNVIQLLEPLHEAAGGGGGRR